MEFKTFADTSASLASIVAIISSFAGWYYSARKPLKVLRVVARKSSKTTNLILVIQNRKAYPVTINLISCYTSKTYEFQKKVGEKIEYSEYLSSKQALFTNHVISSEVPALATTDDVRIILKEMDVPSQLLFSIQTSHGYHEIWCKDVRVIDAENAEVYQLEYRCIFKNKFEALFKYYRKIVGEWATRK